MNTLVRKEIRLLLPAWVAALLLAVIPCWLVVLANPYEPSSAIGIAGSVLLFGILLLGLTSFGQEFSAGTFPQLLSQPIARKRLWRLKVGIQGVAMLSVLLCGLVSCQIAMFRLSVPLETLLEFFAWSACLTLTAFAGGLWTTLLFRQIAAALWFTVLLPLAILLLTMASAEKILQLPVGSPRSLFCAFVALVFYSAAGFLGARRMFLRAQDAQWTGGTISLPNWLRAERQPGTIAPARGPFRALLRKEIQAQHVSLLLSAVLVALHLAAIGLRKASFVQTSTDKLLSQVLGFWWSLWFAMPLLIGSATVAEERKQGTLESQLCLPVTRRLQFWTKLGCTLALGVLLGGFVPWVLESLGALLGFPGEFSAMGKPSSLEALPIFCLVSLGVSFVAFFASTLTRNLLQAMGAAVLVGIVFFVFGTWAFNGGPVDAGASYLWFGPLGILIGLPILVFVMLWLGFWNYKSLWVGWNTWSRNGLLMIASMAVIVLSTTLIFNRAWEWVMPIEPAHGPAQLSGPTPPQILSVGSAFGFLPDGRFVQGQKLFALLPDGRVWVATRHSFKAFGGKVSIGNPPDHTERLVTPFVPVPVNGTFITGSNWVQLAGDWKNLFGIQSDGSLWRMFSASRTNIAEDLSIVPIPERIGADADWKSVVAGGTYFLMLKSDGRIWGWGRNEGGQLGPGSAQPTNELARVGYDSDWASVFASQGTSVGIKRDGSVWKWGYLAIGPTGYEKGWKQSPRPEPVQWGLQGTDWREFVSLSDSDLILKADGSLWAWGNVRADMFGYHLFENQNGIRFVAQPLRIGGASDWTEIASNYGALVGLKRGGAIIRSERYGSRLVCWGDTWRPSRHKDWLAIRSDSWSYPCLALAADGTLSSWAEFNSYQIMEAHSFLGPSRKPLWTVNILANK